MTVLTIGVAFILLAVALIDFDIREIPDGLIIALIPFAIAAVWVQPHIEFISRGLGMLVVSVPMLILALIINGAFGGGDIKLIIVCGFLLGWQNTLLAFFIALFSAGCFSIPLIVKGKAKKGTQIAFGPHLCLGVMTGLLYGREMILWYLRLFGLAQ